MRHINGSNPLLTLPLPKNYNYITKNHILKRKERGELIIPYVELDRGGDSDHNSR